MKKLVLSLAAGVMAASMAASAASTINFEINGSNAMVIGETVETKTTAHPIYVPVDKSYISVDDVKAFLGADVEILDEASAKLTKNGESYTGECIEKDGVFYLPLRAAAEMTGFDVEYVFSHNSILISDKPAAVKVNGVTGVSADELAFYYDRIGAPGGNVTEEMVQQAKNDTVQGLTENAIIYQTAINSGFSATMMNEEAKAGIKTNSETFEVPVIAALENEKINVISMYLNTIATAITEPAEEEIAEYYKENYVTAKHILVLSEGGKAASDEEAKKEAERILKEVKAGKDFDKLMTEFCEDPGVQTNPDGYTFTKGEMVPEFETAAYALKEDEVSDVIKTSYGYHIIKRLPLSEMGDAQKQAVAINIKNKEYSDFVFGLFEKATVEKNDEVIASIK